ncbi:hypothetical protein TNCV_5136261 [Trichonephila clavipes]|nr:hypothetical protein TNCV_5136261 [Trichonephila clavipes]
MNLNERRRKKKIRCNRVERKWNHFQTDKATNETSLFPQQPCARWPFHSHFPPLPTRPTFISSATPPPPLLFTLLAKALRQTMVGRELGVSEERTKKNKKKRTTEQLSEMTRRLHSPLFLPPGVMSKAGNLGSPSEGAGGDHTRCQLSHEFSGHKVEGVHTVWKGKEAMVEGVRCVAFDTWVVRLGAHSERESGRKKNRNCVCVMWSIDRMVCFRDVSVDGEILVILNSSGEKIRRSDVTTDILFAHTMSGFSYPKGDKGNKRNFHWKKSISTEEWLMSETSLFPSPSNNRETINYSIVCRNSGCLVLLLTLKPPPQI